MAFGRNMMNIKDLEKLTWQEISEKLKSIEPKNCTWYDVANFLRKTYSKEYLTDLYICLYSKLLELDLDGEEADDLRDFMDPYGFACEHFLLQKKLHEFLDKKEGKMM